MCSVCRQDTSACTTCMRDVYSLAGGATHGAGLRRGLGVQRGNAGGEDVVEAEGEAVPHMGEPRRHVLRVQLARPAWLCRIAGAAAAARVRHHTPLLCVALHSTGHREPQPLWSVVCACFSRHSPQQPLISAPGMSQGSGRACACLTVGSIGHATCQLSMNGNRQTTHADVSPFRQIVCCVQMQHANRGVGATEAAPSLMWWGGGG